MAELGDGPTVNHGLPDEDPRFAGRRQRSPWARGLILVLSLGLSTWILWTGREDLARLRDVGALSLAGLVGLQLLTLLLQSERLRVTVEHQSKRRIPATRWNSMFVRGRLAGVLAGVFGNTLRAVELKRSDDVSYTHYAVALAAQLWISTVLALLLAALASIAVKTDSGPRILAIAVVAMVAPAALSWVLRLLPEGIRALPLVGRLVATAEELGRTLLDRQWLGRVSILVGLGLLTGSLTLLLAFRVGGQPVGLATALIILAFLQIATAVVVTPGNLGIQELGMAGLATAFGLPAAVGVIASGLIRATGLIALAIGSVISHAMDR